jgi:hypothetical protein
MAIVYRHIRKDNLQPFYIGIGKEKKRAYKTHKSNRNKHWINIYKKYGHIVEILTKDIGWEDACELEMFLISKYGRIDNKTGILVNMTNGGEGQLGVIPSKETRLKISKSQMGNKINLGKEHSQETKRKISNAKKGIKMSEDTKLKISESNKGIYPSEESRLKMSISKTKRSLKVILNKENGIFYLGCKEAAESVGYSECHLNKMLRNKRVNKTNLMYV